MKLTRREFFAVGTALALSACGGSGDEAPVEEEKKSAKTKDVKTSDVKTSDKSKTDESADDLEDATEEDDSSNLIEVSDTTYYEVFRVDMRKGFLGDVEVYTQNTTDFGDYYAILYPDGTFNLCVFDHVYNGTISLGGPDHHLYSGMDDADVTRILFDGEKEANVGDTDIEGFYVDGYILIRLPVTIDGTFTDMTFYFWKTSEEE